MLLLRLRLLPVPECTKIGLYPQIYKNHFRYPEMDTGSFAFHQWLGAYRTRKCGYVEILEKRKVSGVLFFQHYNIPHQGSEPPNGFVFVEVAEQKLNGFGESHGQFLQVIRQR